MANIDLGEIFASAADEWLHGFQKDGCKVVSPAPREVIVGTAEHSFYLDAEWPNELGSAPDDLIGRAVKSCGRYYKVISREGSRYVCEPRVD